MGILFTSAYLVYSRPPVSEAKSPQGPDQLHGQVEPPPLGVEQANQPGNQRVKSELGTLEPAPAKRAPQPLPPPIDIVDDLTGMKFATIKPGQFKMGCLPGEHGANDEQPQHVVLIRRPFLIGRSEVTQAEYEKVTGESPSHFTGDGRRPVEKVSWLDAIRFCNALSAKPKSGLTPFYRIDGEIVTIVDWAGEGYRLPTEAEWEYACRGGVAGPSILEDQDSDLEKHAWYRQNSQVDGFFSTHPVGELKPNGFDVLDMHGNVWEWCWDWYADQYAQTDPAADPIGPPSGKFRVLRGGAYNSAASSLRCSIRNKDTMDSRSQCNGFRVARNLPPN